MARQQPAPYFAHHSFLHFDDENGLPANDVTGFYEDVNGYCWFTTQFGLVRFDGKHFRHFFTGNVPTLISNRVFGLSGDRKGSLFFASEGGGVHKIEGDGQIQYVPGVTTGYNFLMGNHGYVLDIRPYLNNAGDSARLMGEPLAGKESFVNQEFYPEANGNAWFVGSTGISYYQQGHCQWVDSINYKTAKHFYTHQALFVVDSLGAIQVYQAGVKTNHRFLLSDILSTLKEKGPPDLTKARFFSNQTGTFLRYRDHLLSFDYDGKALRPIWLLHNLQLPMPKGVYYSSRYRLYIMRTSTSGFYLVHDQPFNVHSYSEGMENNFTATVEIRPMQVLATNGLLVSPDTVVRVYPLYSIGWNALLKDRAGHTWLIARDTLKCLDSNLKTLKWWKPADTRVASIQEDGAGTIWYATDLGLAKIDSGQLRFVYQDSKDFGRTQCLFPLNDTVLWVGTTRGLYSYHKQLNTITPVAAMAGRYVRHIYRAKDGNLWIGTYGQGFYTYRGGQFIALPLDKKGRLATPHCFMEDDNGYFWIPTNNGLLQVRKVALEAWLNDRKGEVYYHYYDKYDGFATREFNGGCSPVGLRLQDGSFSLPSMKGLVWFNPLQVQPILPAGIIQIDQVLADTVVMALTQSIRFKAGTRNMRFRISSPFFGNMANFVPEYRIEGSDQSWMPVPADNEIVISSLPAGKYQLELRLRQGFGATNYTSRLQPFSIASSLFETAWFWIGLTLLALGGLWYYWRIKRTQHQLESRQREQQLELQVAYRTEVFQQAISDLKNTEEILHQSNLLKDRLTSIILHDIRSPLRFMNLISNQLSQALAMGDTQSLNALITELKKSSDQLDIFTREFLVWLSTQQSGFKTKREYIDVQQLFNETESHYRNLLHWNSNTLVLDIAPDVSLYTDRQLLKIVLHNLVDNSNKHTDMGTVWISAWYSKDQQVTIKVADSGKGMSVPELKLLQTWLKDGKNQIVTDGTGNLGYRIIRDFVIIMKGTVAVESSMGTGTTVTILFPVSA
jgi:signal transduction histidine kinase